jgi:ubiquinone biosynthesis protein COQ4
MKTLKKIWTLLEGFVAFIRLVRKPSELDLVFEISQRVAIPSVLQSMASEARQKSDQAVVALETRPRMDLDNLYRLLPNLPEGSLGKEFAKFLKDRHLDPNDIPKLEANDSLEYVLAHLYETHDLWHVICGFETDVSGELGLQAFYFAQLPGPLSAILMAAGLLNTALFAMDEREIRMKEIVRGWTMGQNAKLLFGTDWNNQWGTPLKVVQAQMGIIPAAPKQILPSRAHTVPSLNSSLEGSRALA